MQKIKDFFNKLGQEIKALSSRIKVAMATFLVVIMGLLGMAGVGFAPSSGYSETLTQYTESTDTILYVSGVTDEDGNTISCSATEKCYFTLDPGQPDVERAICTGVSGSTVTGCERGIPASGRSETGSSTLAHSHDVGSRIIMTNISQFYNNYINIHDDQTMEGQLTVEKNILYTGAEQTQSNATNTLATIEYVNEIATSGSANASETVKGLVEVATQIEMASSTELGATGANMCISSAYGTSTPGIDGLYVPISLNNGYLHQDWWDPGYDWTQTGEWGFNGNTTMASTTFTATATAQNYIDLEDDPVLDNHAVRKSYGDTNYDNYYYSVTDSFDPGGTNGIKTYTHNFGELPTRIKITTMDPVSAAITTHLSIGTWRTGDVYATNWIGEAGTGGVDTATIVYIEFNDTENYIFKATTTEANMTNTTIQLNYLSNHATDATFNFLVEIFR